MLHTMKHWKRWLTPALALMLILAGCSGGNQNAQVNNGGSGGADSETTAEKLPVRYLLPGNEPEGLSEVVDAINAKLEADGLNLVYQPTYIAWDAWDQKTNLMMSTGEEFELVAIMHDSKGPNVLAGNGGIIPINDLLDEYGPKLKETIPDWAWESVKTDGKIVTVPNFWVDVAMNEGMITFRVDMLEKYGLEPPTTTEELLNVAEVFQKNWPQDNKDVYIKVLTEPANHLHTTYETYPFTVIDMLIYVDQEGNVKPWLETEEFKKDIQFMNEAYKRGLIMKDVLTAPAEVLNQEETAGRYLFRPGDVGINDAVKETFPGARNDAFYMNDGLKFRANALRNSNGVSATSPHPEAGVQFLNWVFSDQANFDLVQSGIEGVHWKSAGDNKKEILATTDNGGPVYELANWLLGHVEFNRYQSNIEDGRLQRRTTIAEDAVNSVTIGFNFDPSNVASAYANSIAELKTSIYPLIYGVVDYDSFFPTALQNMKAAGMDYVIEEYNKQFQEWRSKQ